MVLVLHVVTHNPGVVGSNPPPTFVPLLLHEKKGAVPRITGLSLQDRARLARTSASVGFEDRGEQVLRGFEDPVRLFEAG